ncbi:MAG: PAS domain S-box protein [Chloroflexi bacterium]|nr:PAS domain S-box protein [Chloroflexota bacterium]
MSGDEDKTKGQLIKELAGLRQRVADSERLASEHQQAEEALRESDKKYRSLFEQMLNGFAYCQLLVDENNQPVDFVYLEINDAFERLTGLKREKVIGRKVTEAIPGTKESHPELFSIYGKVALTGEPTTFDIYFEPLAIWLTIHVYSPQRGYFVAVFENITERKQAETALRASEQNFRNSIENSPFGIMIMDALGEMSYGNQAYLNLWGYGSIEELKAIPRKARYTPQTRREVEDRMRKRQRGELVPSHYEGSIVRQDGGIRHLEAVTSELLWDGEKRYQVLYRDITEHKQMEDDLKIKAQLLDAVGDSIRLHDWKRNFVYVNEATCRMLGYSRDELLKMNLRDVLSPEYAKHVAARREEIEAKGETIFETVSLHKDGTLIPLEVHARFVESGMRKLVLSVARDITERKRVEEREQELQKELALSSRLAAIGELAAGVAHEINNPLTGVIGFSQRLLRKSSLKSVRRDLKRIHSEARRAARVVENLLVFARRHQPKKEYSDINDILEKTLELRTYDLKTRNIELEVNLAPDLPRIMADFQQIEQVFLNIILNAEQAVTAMRGGGKLSIKTERAKGCVRISFADDGPGITVEDLDKLFNPFFTTRGDRGGTGLGLSICHGIVTEHNGRIYARSRAGKGATFFVELPLATEAIDEAKVTRKESAGSSQ